MKQKDLLLLGVIVFISAIVSYMLSSKFITSPNNRSAQVEVVDPIVADFNTPTNDKYFNGESVNPTRLIQIQDNKNPSPFNGN